MTDMVCNFLNDNLELHYKNKDYSIISIPCARDSLGTSHITYSLRLDCPNNIDASSKFRGLKGVLDEAIRVVDKIVHGLVYAKSLEKPEGTITKIRDVDVHWRRFPKVIIHNSGAGWENPYIDLCFRISVHHKDE